MNTPPSCTLRRSHKRTLLTLPTFSAELFHRLVSFLTLTALLTFATSLFLMTGCKQSGTGGKPDHVDYYTCTMHPSVKVQDPKAKCPICGMALIPVMKKNARV